MPTYSGSSGYVPLAPARGTAGEGGCKYQLKLNQTKRN